MGETHEQIIGRSFEQQAPTFEDARFSHVLTTASEWLWERLPRGRDDLVLDVAAGTGHAARALAGDVRAVIAVDLTARMLEVGRERAAAEGITNIVFMEANANPLLFLDASFDVVVCRYALHHFPDPAALVGQLARCARAGGHVALADLVATQDHDVAKRQNELELLRDPSHARALSLAELQELLTAEGLRVTSVQARVVRRALEPWMEQTRTSPGARAQIEAALAAEVDDTRPLTGFEPQPEGSSFTVTQTLASVVAQH